MREAMVKYGFFYGSLLVVGVIAWRLTRMSVDAGGGHGTSLLNSSNLTLSIVMGLAAVLLAAGAAFVSGKFVSASGGLLNMGVVLAWGAYGLGTLRQIVLAQTNPETGAGSRTTFTNLAVEAAIVGAVGVAVVWWIERSCRKVDPADAPKSGAWVVTVLCGAAGSVVGIWLIAQSGYKGQVIGAGLVGGLLGGIIAYAMDHQARLWPLVAGCAAVSAAGPVVALVKGGSDSALHAAVIAGTIPRWSLLTGLDGMAGACLGVPVGLYVAKGLLGHAGHIAEDAR